MATIINNPPSQTPVESETNSWVGLTLMVFILFLILYLGVPYFRNMNQPQTPVETNAPAMEQPTQQPAEATQAPQPTSTETNGNTIMIPDKIDVNINQTSPSPTQ